MEFAEGDKVFLKVSSMKDIVGTGGRNKLDPRYIWPFEILERVGPLAYQLALPPKIEKIL